MTGMLTLVGTAVREGVLDPGVVPDEARRRRRAGTRWPAAGVIILVLVGMRAWWRSEDRAFRERMFRPLSVKSGVIIETGRTRVDTSPDVVRLVLMITDSSWLARDEVDVLRARGELSPTGLIDDHGKLMHLFLVGENVRAMAHLHPKTKDSVRFTSIMPALPEGTYRVFADIVHRSGFTQTLTSSVVVPRIATDQFADGCGRFVVGPRWSRLHTRHARRRDGADLAPRRCASSSCRRRGGPPLQC